MKAMKKLASLLLALVMALALAVPAFAAGETYSITIANAAAGHTYEAYQIFAGDLSTNADGKKVLSNIIWGNGVSDEGKAALGDAAAKAESIKTEADAKAFAQAVAPYLVQANASTSSSQNSEGKYVISNLAAGYYLVKDQDNSLKDQDDFYTAYIMEVVGNVNAEPKGSAPSSEKKVKDVNDSTGDTTGWQDSADYDIGDNVPFQLKATLPENYADYKAYKLTFHDKQSEGLTFNADSVKVYVDGNEITTGYAVKTTDLSDGCTFEVVFADLKQIDAVKAVSEITVEYTAELNDKAVAGNTGNSNSMHITYSNNPNDEQGGEGGKTPEDITIVFTYQLIVDKTDGNNPLTGAGFTLYKKNSNGDYIAVGTEIKGEDITRFTWSGLDDGDYKLVETTTPTGYNTMEDIFFTIKAVHDGTGTDSKLTSLNGNVEGNKLTFTSDVSKGSLSTAVVNKAGSTLPSTGGIGTTIFYVVGSVLVIGAAVVLITRKRMGKSDK